MQDQACLLFTEIESQGAELEQVILSAEQHLEGLVNDALIQEFTKQEATTKQQVEAAQAKLEAELIISEWLGTSHRWVLGACWALTKFSKFLGHVDLFWDFESLSKEERKMKQISWDLGPLLGPFLDFWDNVTGKGCRPVGLPTLSPTFVIYK